VLAPLAALQSEAELRSSSNLMPLDPSAVPQEVRGFIESINQMMTRLSHSIESQRHFVANAAHQLRTPVAGVRLQAQIALKNLYSGNVLSNLHDIEESAARMAHIIEQLLVLSKAEADELIADAEHVDITAVARHVIERYLPMALGRSTDLGYEGAAEGAIVMGNEVLLSELLANLVDNSIRYGRRGGQVTVITEVTQRHVLLSVSDDGPGFAHADQERLFQRFDRSDSSASGGAGLGLSIVREIANRSHAKVALKSNEGKGSRVVITFNRAELTADSSLHSE